MTQPRQLAFLAASVLVFLGGCGTPSTPTSVVSPSPATSQPVASPAPITAAAAATLIRATVTGAHPLLLPTNIPAGWSALVTSVNSSTFNVTYTSPDKAKSVNFAIEVANPPPPGPNGTQANPNFDGDSRSLYQVDDKTQPTSNRFLTWNEPGTWSQPNGVPGVPYFMVGNGMTDAEFWSVAKSVNA